MAHDLTKTILSMSKLSVFNCATQISNNTKETFRRQCSKKTTEDQRFWCTSFYPPWVSSHFENSVHLCSQWTPGHQSKRKVCEKIPKTMNHIRFLKVTYFSRFVFSWNELSCFSDYKNLPVLSIIAGMGFLFWQFCTKKLPLSYGH